MEVFQKTETSIVLILLIGSLSIERISCDSLTNSKCQKDAEGFCHPHEKMAQTPCNLTPSSEEGPFFLPDMPIRKDITEGRPGVPLTIEFTVKDIKTCQPIKGASVHMWQADALGVYSAYSGYYPLGAPGSKQITGRRSKPTEKATFLRGIQNTDENGKATFKTIYPGWYAIRALHSHFKITTNGESRYTGEIYFPDGLTEEVSKVEPYKRHPGKRIKNGDDWQFVNENGEAMVMTPIGNTKDGFVGSMEIIIDLNAIDN